MEHVAGSFVFQVASSCRANGEGGKKCLLLYGIVEKISLCPLRLYPFESTTGNVASKEPMLKCGFLCLKSIWSIIYVLKLDLLFFRWNRSSWIRMILKTPCWKQLLNCFCRVLPMVLTCEQLIQKPRQD